MAVQQAPATIAGEIPGSRFQRAAAAPSRRCVTTASAPQSAQTTADQKISIRSSPEAAAGSSSESAVAATTPASSVPSGTTPSVPASCRTPLSASSSSASAPPCSRGPTRRVHPMIATTATTTAIISQARRYRRITMTGSAISAAARAPMTSRSSSGTRIRTAPARQTAPSSSAPAMPATARECGCSPQARSTSSNCADVNGITNTAANSAPSTISWMRTTAARRQARRYRRGLRAPPAQRRQRREHGSGGERRRRERRYEIAEHQQPGHLPREPEGKRRDRGDLELCEPALADHVLVARDRVDAAGDPDRARQADRDHHDPCDRQPVARRRPRRPLADPDGLLERQPHRPCGVEPRTRDEACEQADQADAVERLEPERVVVGPARHQLAPFAAHRAMLLDRDG